MTKLLIVESPSKAKTISNYLGSEYKVLASYGHIRNLLPKSEGINTENFEMNFQLIDRNKKHMDAISKAAKASEEVLLATDPDREGEAIAWHIAEILNSKKLIKNNPAPCANNKRLNLGLYKTKCTSKPFFNKPI